MTKMENRWVLQAPTIRNLLAKSLWMAALFTVTVAVLAELLELKFGGPWVPAVQMLPLSAAIGFGIAGAVITVLG